MSSADPSPGELAPINQRATALRLRVSGLPSGQPSQAAWRQGGEGLGGEARRGYFNAPGGAPLGVGEWSEPLRLIDALPAQGAQPAVLTITAGESGRVKGHAAAKDVHFEVEQLDGARVVKHIETTEPDGGTLTLWIPGTAAGEDALVGELSTAAEVANARLALLRPQRAPSLPHELSVVSDLGGYGEGSGYAIRVTSLPVVRTELQSLLELGITGLRTVPEPIWREGRPGGSRWRARLIGPFGYATPDKRRAPDVAGCPFDPGLSERAKEQANSVLSAARTVNSDEVWALTVDEIGAVTDLSTAGKEHLAQCERCRAGFVSWLKGKHLAPNDVGARSWSDVRPLSIWSAGPKPWQGSGALRRRAYLTREFLNVVSAQMFTPLRDALAGYRPAGDEEPRVVRSYALRPCTFVSNGSSLDFFEFYRHADNAIVWETSDRDPRAWSWDSYLMDVQRVLGARLGLAEGIYVKPHRGAPVQRALSAVARGNTMLYWYTYGPEYWKGDAFAGSVGSLRATQQAAGLLGGAEPWLYGAHLAAAPRVAIVKPETTAAWTTLGADGSLAVASLENAKWIYTALQHAHVPVDPLDERLLIEANLADYAAIYVNGTHITRAAASALARYVKAGGTLVTSAGGLTRDESDSPLTTLDRVFGVRRRQAPAKPCHVDVYRATRFQSLESCPELDRLTTAAATEPLVIGSERLDPLPETQIWGTFGDGSPALLRHTYGKGSAFLLGTFAGLEYAAPVLRDGFDMRQGFQAARLQPAVAPVADLLGRPVECSEPLVDPVLLESPDSKHALTLVNWAYMETPEGVKHQAAERVRLFVHGVASVRRVYSVAQGQEVPFVVEGDGVRFELERLDEADVVRIE